MAVLKKWGLPLLRTFLAAAVPVVIASVTAVQAGTVNLGNLSWWWALVGGAVTAGVNAVIIAAQKVVPGVPDPVPVNAPVPASTPVVMPPATPVGTLP